jgi:hypothetical protein
MVKENQVAESHRSHEVARLVVPHTIPTGGVISRLRQILD